MDKDKEDLVNKLPTILYEDIDIVAINKPSGLVVHSDGRTEEKTLVDWIIEKFPESQNVGESIITTDGKEIKRPGIIHRLDRETSGVMLIAKTKKGFDCLKNQFKLHTVSKEYRAFVYGKIKEDKGIINRPIGRSKKDFRMWSAQRGARGEMREAVTEYEVRFRSELYTFVSAFPKTGRTHQIRVHFKAINYPLVCDSLYAPDRGNDLGFTRLALHSYRITFEDTSGQNQTITCPYPEDFVRAELILEEKKGCNT